ncbi:hypothetical protein DV515_00002158, partial [Chloebia gouldiae]
MNPLTKPFNDIFGELKSNVRGPTYNPHAHLNYIQSHFLQHTPERPRPRRQHCGSGAVTESNAPGPALSNAETRREPARQETRRGPGSQRSDFFERTILCNSLVWSCAVTGKPGLTYQEALESEKKARHNLQSFPEALIIPVLYLATLTHRTRLHEICDEIFAYVKD